MRSNPLIFAGCALKRPKYRPVSTSGPTDRDGAPPAEAMEQKGDLLIRDLWHNGTEYVYNMRVLNTDAKTDAMKTPDNCL